MKGLYQKREWWYYQPPTPKNGTRPKPVALKTRDEVEAMIRAKDHRDEDEMVRAVRKGTLEEILPEYYKAGSEDAKITRRTREMVLSGFSAILGNPRLSELDEAMIANWRKQLDVKGGTLRGRGPVSVATKRSYLIVLNAFLNWCKGKGYIKTNPAAKWRKQAFVQVTRRQEFLSVEERERLLADAKAPEYVRFILHFGFFAGLRDGEMLAMTPEWLWISPDGTQGTLTVQDTNITRENGSTGVWRPKGRRRRVIPLHDRILAFLKTYGLRRPWMLAPQKELWPNDETNAKRFDAKNAMRGLAMRAAVGKLNYHILRHSFATHLAMNGVPLAEIAALLGDRLSVTEDHYAGYAPNGRNPLAGL